MAVDQKTVLDELEHRRYTAEQISDSYDGRRNLYSTHRSRVVAVDAIIDGNMPFAWPDGMRDDGDPKVPNLVSLSIEDRQRAVSAAVESIICRPEKLKDDARTAAEKRERVIEGYWYRNRVRGKKVDWAADLMVAGFSLCKVLPDWGVPLAERFPKYMRVDPRFAYPGPTFASGPFLDDIIVSYEDDVRAVGRRFGRSQEIELMLAAQPHTANRKRIQVVEFYDKEYLCAFARVIGQGRTLNSWEWLIEPTDHYLGVCPVVLGRRPTGDLAYRGDFDGVLPVMNLLNKFMTMEMDAAIDRVYPERLDFDIANPDVFGPDAALTAQTPLAKREYITKPSSGFQNVQMLGLLQSFARTSALLSPSRTGDPNESIISAAGITAADAQRAEHVASLLRDSLSPMLEAANEVAFRADEKHCDAEKEITGTSRGAAFTESYRPTKDIKGIYRNEVRYGVTAGLDPINQNVMTLQQLGKVISQETAMELSPFVENPQVEAKKMAKEQLQAAMYAGLIAKAANNEIDPRQVANIWRDLESESKTLADAIEDNLIVSTPLATPPGMPGMEGLAGAPGVPGAARGQAGAAPFQGPPLGQLMSGGRP